MAVQTFSQTSPIKPTLTILNQTQVTSPSTVTLISLHASNPINMYRLIISSDKTGLLSFKYGGFFVLYTRLLANQTQDFDFYDYPVIVPANNAFEVTSEIDYATLAYHIEYTQS